MNACPRDTKDGIARYDSKIKYLVFPFPTRTSPPPRRADAFILMNFKYPKFLINKLIKL